MECVLMYFVYGDPVFLVTVETEKERDVEACYVSSVLQKGCEVYKELEFCNTAEVPTFVTELEWGCVG